MPAMRHLFPIVAVLLAGCSSVPKPGLNTDHAEERAQIRLLLDEIFDAAERKDLDRLDGYHLYGPKFTKFGAEQPGCQDATATRQHEHAGVGGASELAMQAEDLKIDVFGPVAIATFIMKYSFQAGADRVEKAARSTMVFVRDHGAWKIAHEHFSPVTASP